MAAGGGVAERKRERDLPLMALLYSFDDGALSVWGLRVRTSVQAVLTPPPPTPLQSLGGGGTSQCLAGISQQKEDKRQKQQSCMTEYKTQTEQT